MKSIAWKILSSITACCMVLIAAASIFSGGCEGTLACDMGAVPMKCHWTFIVLPYVAAVGLCSSFSAFLAQGKEGRRIAAVLTFATCCAIFAISSPLGIGLCANPQMHCHETAHMVWAACAAASAVSVIQLAKASPEKEGLPKMKL